MSLHIRLARWGSANSPFYGIVVCHRHKARDGKHVERLGTYNPVPQQDTSASQKHILALGPSSSNATNAPLTTQKHVQLNVERIKFHLANGASMSSKVSWLLAKAGLVPHLPVQLQRTGSLTLDNPKTWQVQLTLNGKVVGLMDRSEAIRQCKEQNQTLHPDLVDKQCVLWDFGGVDLTKECSGEMSDAERLRIVKAVTGIE